MSAYEMLGAIIGSKLEDHKKAALSAIWPSEWIDEEDMLIWSFLGDHFENERLQGFPVLPTEAFREEVLVKFQPIIRWAEFENWIGEIQQLDPVGYSWAIEVEYQDLV